MTHVENRKFLARLAVMGLKCTRLTVLCGEKTIEVFKQAIDKVMGWLDGLPLRWRPLIVYSPF